MQRISNKFWLNQEILVKLNSIIFVMNGFTRCLPQKLQEWMNDSKKIEMPQNFGSCIFSFSLRIEIIELFYLVKIILDFDVFQTSSFNSNGLLSCKHEFSIFVVVNFIF